MRKSISLAVLLLLSTIYQNQILAQSFGYEGKKLLVSGSLGFAPRLISFFDKEDGIKVNSALGITTEYSLFNSTSLGLNFNYLTTTTKFLPTLSREFQSNTYYYKPITNKSLRATELDFFLKKYYRVSAPLGMFFGISFGRHSLNFEDKSIQYYNESLISPYNIYTIPFDDNVRAYYVGFEHGVNRVLTDKVIIKFSASCRLNGNLLGEIDSEYNPTSYEIVEKSMKNRVGLHSFFRFELGFGYLIF